MYKYFSELDKPNDFEVYLQQGIFDYVLEKKYHVRNTILTENNFSNYKELFGRIDILDMLINSTNYNSRDRLIPFSYEDWQNFGQFQTAKEEIYDYAKRLKNKIDLNPDEIHSLLIDYLAFDKYLMGIYPNLKVFFKETEKIIIDAIEVLKKKNTLKIVNKKRPCIYTAPNAWYITPNGFLYNTGGNKGHKNGNLIYPFYRTILEGLNRNRKILNINNYEEIKRILKRGYITPEEFNYYANLIYNLPTIHTPEIERDIERTKNIMNLPEETLKKIKLEDFPHPERSYQKNLITLVTGHLAAEALLFQSFVILNDSQRKNKIINNLMNICNYFLPDILVRYCHFHKVESMIKNTITTYSLNGISDFKEF